MTEGHTISVEFTLPDERCDGATVRVQIDNDGVNGYTEVRAEISDDEGGWYRLPRVCLGWSPALDTDD